MQDFEDFEEFQQLDLTRRIRDRENHLEALDEVEFYRRYKLSKETVRYVYQQISVDLQNGYENFQYIPPMTKLLVALRYFGTGSFQIVVGDILTVSQPVCSRIIKDVSCAIARLRPQHIRYPSFQEAPTVYRKFREVAGFPGVIGLIDGTHIKIPSPGGEHAELFRNRKGTHSINVQVVCGCEFKFINIVARWWGSAHDSRIFQESKLCADLEERKVPGLLLGDAGYPCLPFLMTPFQNPVTEAEQNYNIAHARTRNGVERLIGAWKRKFACISWILRTKLSTSLATIIATAVLFNISRDRNEQDEDCDGLSADPPEESDEPVHNQLFSLGQAKRQAILQHFIKC